MLPTLTLLPWFAMVAALVFLARRRPRLDDYPAPVDAEAPRVTVVVPTRNDAHRIGLFLTMLLNSDYPDFEVNVVDDDSTDGTREIVQALSSRAPQRVRLIRPGPIPDARSRRAWACLRGCREATGELLLFTEPGTVHEPEALGRAVSALRQEGADLVSARPRWSMHGFWERLVTPHVWLMVRARFPSVRLVNRSHSPRNALGHHQFLLFRRKAYERFGGHAVVGPGDVEDLVIAQAAVRAGLRLFLVHGETYLETRMYRQLGDITGDWVAFLPLASRATFVPRLAALAPWVAAVTPLLLFLLPLVVLGLGIVLPGGEVMTLWGLWTTGLALVFWLVIYTVHRIRPAYALAYPVGALATAILFARSALRHGND
jgi:chlorobactene glucosyltransferase